MNVEAVTSTFSPGDHVFLQGERINDYYKVVTGQFVKVRSRIPANSFGVRKMLAAAEFLKVVSHQELMGEIEALMGSPLPFSVFALDDSKVLSVPASRHSDMIGTLYSNPQIGIKTCISFARYLRQFFSYFARISREEVAIASFCKSTARDYLAAINELEAVPTNRDSAELAEAKSCKAFALARAILAQPQYSEKSLSVACGIVSINGNTIKPQQFRAGTLLCAKGMVGDSLFIIVEGSVEVLTEGNNNNIIIDEPGSVIGEIAVFLNLADNRQNTRRTAHVVCRTDLSAIVLKLDQVENFFAQQPEIMIRILTEMVSRSSSTRTMCLQTEKRLNEKLYGELGVLLEALNSLAHKLAKNKYNSSFLRPTNFCAQRARTVYERFKRSLKLLEERKRIET